jgi:hypothetical protein
MEQAVAASSDYTAVQREDSLQEDPMPQSGQNPASTSPALPTVAGDNLARPSGVTGPIDDGRA